LLMLWVLLSDNRLESDEMNDVFVSLDYPIF